MKIGLVSAILEDYDFKKMIDTVSEIGYECVEVACWPKAKAERRYAGVSHIDVANLGDKEAEEILSYCKEKNVEISSLAFYPNTMDGNLEKRAANIEHLYKVIDASKKLGINLVTTFIGRNQTKTVEENLELVKKSGFRSCVTQRKRKFVLQSKTARCSLTEISGQVDRT